MKNDSDSIQYVTTKDFVVKDITNDKYLTEEAMKKIFPPNKITKEFILFTRLKPKISNDIPGESINLKVRKEKLEKILKTYLVDDFSNTTIQ